MKPYELKVFAMFYINEHDNLTKKQKLQLMEWVKDTDTGNVINLLITGEPKNLSLAAKSKVMESFSSSPTAEMLNEAFNIAEIDWKEVAKGAKEIAKGSAKTGKKYLKTAGEVYKKAGGKAVAKVRGKVAKKLYAGSAKDAAAARDAARDAAAKAAEKARTAYKKGTSIFQGKQGLKGRAMLLKKDVGKAGKEAYEKGSQMAKAGAEKVSQAASKAAELAKAHPGLAAAAAAAAVAAAGFLVYKRFFSKAAKACKGSPDRKACIQDFKQKARNAQAAALRSKMSICAKSKDPAGCKSKVQAKIAKLTGK